LAIIFWVCHIANLGLSKRVERIIRKTIEPTTYWALDPLLNGRTIQYCQS